jgi:uncharacterized protein YegJ (DUF2314 family)
MFAREWKMKGIVFFFFLVFISIGAHGDSVVERAESDQVTLIPEDDPHMAKAMYRARGTLDEFLEVYEKRSGNQTSFAVKVGIEDGGQTEYFWLGDFYEKEEGIFIGVINNEPRLVSNVRFGQPYTFEKNAIVDWVYMEGEKMKGNYTACALLRHEPKEQQEQFKKQYGLECDL